MPDLRRFGGRHRDYDTGASRSALAASDRGNGSDYDLGNRAGHFLAAFLPLPRATHRVATAISGPFRDNLITLGLQRP